VATILLINPNKWGRGITVIWAASHAAVLRKAGHHVHYFDCTFFSNWTDNENAFNTSNHQYAETDYNKKIIWKKENVKTKLEEKIIECEPDIIFWSALSSHIHGEGEYVNLQYGYQLLEGIETKFAKLVVGGLQTTAEPSNTMERFPLLDFAIAGESELVLLELSEKLSAKDSYKEIKGLIYRSEGIIRVNNKQEIISNMDKIAPYDYSIFEDQVFYRPYNGLVERAVDYEISRGCIYSCSYCVETIIQSYYGFSEILSGGVISNAPKYLRCKSAEIAFLEMKKLHEDYGVRLFRFQDTNFLSINKETLKGLSEMIDNSDMDIKLYIETRPEGINSRTIDLMKKLKVDGVGMGVELSAQDFREDALNRYADTKKIYRAFELLKSAGIRRTTYNVIGFPDQDEDSIVNTIKFNIELEPDNVTVAFYTPFIGTKQQKKGVNKGNFEEYEYDLDPQLRTATKTVLVSAKTLEFYKKNFNYFVRNGLDKLECIKAEFGL